MIHQENRDLVLSITKIKNLPIWFDTIGKVCHHLGLCKGCYNSVNDSEYCQQCYDSIMEELK